MRHIPNRYFTSSFTTFEIWDVINKYSDSCWDSAKIYNSNNKISKNAIAITKRVKTYLNIELFPLITKIASKGFDISGGTFAFSMIDIKGDVYYFDFSARFYTQKKYKLYLTKTTDYNIISIE